jgi:hypothetical protein
MICLFPEWQPARGGAAKKSQALFLAAGRTIADLFGSGNAPGGGQTSQPRAL